MLQVLCSSFQYLECCLDEQDWGRAWPGQAELDLMGSAPVLQPWALIFEERGPARLTWKAIWGQERICPSCCSFTSTLRPPVGSQCVLRVYQRSWSVAEGTGTVYPAGKMHSIQHHVLLDVCQQLNRCSMERGHIYNWICWAYVQSILLQQAGAQCILSFCTKKAHKFLSVYCTDSFDKWLLEIKYKCS